MDSVLAKTAAVLLAILGLSILVIIHEAGHYLVARAYGMRVLRFSTGFGPVLAKFQPKGSPTVFQISAIPFLAYVQIAGMNPAEEIDDSDPELFPNKSVFARTATIFAGPFANYITASAIVFVLCLQGFLQPPREPMVVGDFSEKSPAQEAGLKEGDVIVEAEGEPIANVLDLIAVTQGRAGQPTEYVIERNGERQQVTITPMKSPQDGRGLIGVMPEPAEKAAMGVGEAAVYSVVYPFQITVAQVMGLQRMAETGNTKDVKGPVGIVQLIASVVYSPARFAQILMLISVALGFFNLLPVPGLDGGRLAFLGYELVTRRRPNQRVEGMVHLVGIVFLLGLIALVTLRDVAG